MPLYNIKKIISKKPKTGLIFPRLNISWPYPLFLLVHITLSCNRKCQWCYQGNDEFYLFHNGQMQVDVFKKILLSFKFFKPHIHLFGGEPLLHKEFSQFLEISRLCGYKPTLTTNGDYLDRYSKVIMQSSLSQLNISLNGVVDCYGNFNQNLLKNIKDFLNLNGGRKIINLSYVIEKQTLDYLEELILYLNKDYKKGDFSFLVLGRANFIPGIKSQDPDLDLVKLEEKLRRFKKTKFKFELLFLPDIKLGDLNTYYKTDYAFKNRCYVPWLGLAIYPDSSVSPGGGIFGCNYYLGNLTQKSIMDIWKGNELKDLRSRLIKKGLPYTCNRCSNKQYY